MDLSVIIVSYNTRELTLACIASLYAQTQAIRFEVFVVDNASQDGSADDIAQAFPQVRLIRLDQNIGFAAANNLAADQATGEMLLLLNPDTVVIDRAVEKLVFFARTHPAYPIFSGRTLYSDRTLNPTSCWRRSTAWSSSCQACGLSSLFRRTRVFDPESIGYWKRDTVREVDIVTGCFLLIRMPLWRELGGFDRDFFMYGEDADLCLRAARIGAKCLICPEATIIHYRGASETVRSEKLIRLFIAKAKLFAKHSQRPVGIAGVMMLDMWALHRTCVYGIIAVFHRRKREQFETWRTVWNRRHEWRSAAEAMMACAPPPVSEAGVE